jgi:dihydrofolate reductase
MQIRTRFSITADGYVTTPDGWPPLVRDRQFVSGQSHGIPEFQENCEAGTDGRTTFEPALTNDRWPWPNLDVFVLGSDVPTDGAPVPIVADSDPARLLEKLRSTNRGGDVHLVGGVRTIETFRAMGALDKLGLLVLPSRGSPHEVLVRVLDPDDGDALAPRLFDKAGNVRDHYLALMSLCDGAVLHVDDKTRGVRAVRECGHRLRSMTGIPWKYGHSRSESVACASVRE